MSIKDDVKWFAKIASLRTTLVLVIDAVQSEPPQNQILGAGLAFYTMCKGVGIDPHETLEMLYRMESDIDGPFANQFQAMLEYAKGELRNP